MVRRDAMELFVEPLHCSKSDDRRGRRNFRNAQDASRYIYIYQSSSFTSPCGLTDDAAVAAAAVSLLTCGGGGDGWTDGAS